MLVQQDMLQDLGSQGQKNGRQAIEGDHLKRVVQKSGSPTIPPHFLQHSLRHLVNYCFCPCGISENFQV